MVSISSKQCSSRAMLDLIIWIKITMQSQWRIYTISCMLFVLIYLCATNNYVLEFINSSHPSFTSMSIMQTSFQNANHTWNPEENIQEMSGVDREEEMNRTVISTDEYGSFIQCLSHWEWK